MTHVQTHFLKENFNALQVCLCALISRPVYTRTRAQLRVGHTTLQKLLKTSPLFCSYLRTHYAAIAALSYNCASWWHTTKATLSREYTN